MGVQNRLVCTPKTFNNFQENPWQHDYADLKTKLYIYERATHRVGMGNRVTSLHKQIAKVHTCNPGYHKGSKQDFDFL